MKSTWNYKLLQFLNNKKEDGGFTLIELLVVIIIIGILSAIALPAFLNQANRARQSEAVTYVGSMNRAQQAFYLERSDFATAIASLGLGIPEDTDNYAYFITRPTADADAKRFVTNHAGPGELNDSGDFVGNAAAPVRAYVGGVAVAEVNPQEIDDPANPGDKITVTETTTVAILCEANQPPVNGGADGSQVIVSVVAADGGVPTCPTGADRDGYTKKS